MLSFTELYLDQIACDLTNRTATARVLNLNKQYIYIFTFDTLVTNTLIGLDVKFKHLPSIYAVNGYRSETVVPETVAVDDTGGRREHGSRDIRLVRTSINADILVYHDNAYT